ncbi:transcription factor bHLH143-like [Andrographis paniculata]|uniref:transcription factor bHLH143-like n=1 Tax=Andrographis paniculata TaxID=175694 RepID=UPI0021E99046|nr:transcription factor bHLH143-like [Andrographis paniculata]XP_051114064.1 transcription factor bHLH143-like [Andrographis paniculata]
MDSGFGFHHQNLDLFGFPFDTGDPNACPSFGNPYLVEDTFLKNTGSFPISGFHQFRANISNDPQNWLNRMPYFPESNSSMSPFDIGQPISPKTVDLPAQKRFIVFDQSGDKTALICTYGVVKIPAQLEPSWSPKPSKNHPRDSIHPLSPLLADGKVDEEDRRNRSEDEMHEDTEELNALLCSDSDVSEDDEETSTGHSPSSMTDNYVHGLVEEFGEEVDSFSGPTKRSKLNNGEYPATSNDRHTSPLRKTPVWLSLEYDNDAQSSCGDRSNSSSSGGKRSRKEKIRETVSILQSIIPSAKGKIAIDVIDEAINYLRSLKAKALGVDPV